MEETEAMELYWRPKLDAFLADKKKWLKLSLKMLSKKEAKRVRRCKRNLRNARLGGFAHESQAI